MNDFFTPQEEKNNKFKPDAYFNAFKMKWAPGSFRKEEQYLGWNCTGSVVATAKSKIRTFRFHPSSYTLELDKYEQKGHDSTNVKSLAWHPSNPDLLAYIASEQPSYYLWDIRQKNISKGPTPKAGDKNVDNLNVVYSPDGNTLALCNRDNKLTFFDTRKEQEICEVQLEMDVHEFQWDPSGSVIILVGSLGGSGTVQVSSGKDFSKANVDLLDKTMTECHSLKIQCMAIDPKGRYFATGSTDTLIGLWDLEEFTMLKTFSQSDYAIQELSFSYDGALLAAIFNDKNIAIHNTQTGAIGNILERDSIVHSIQWHPKQNILAFLSDDHGENEGNLRLYGAF